jgi:uncharacterized membrane protein YidH (DUF202 family)
MAMSDEQKTLADVLMKLYQEHSTQGRHHEIQRSAVVTAIIAVASAVIGLVTYDRAITRSDLPLTIFLIGIGVFGAAFAMKHYERFNLHTERGRAHRNALDKLLGEVLNLSPPLAPLRTSADARNTEAYPRLSKLRLHYWWLSLSLIVAVVGGVLSAIALFCPQKVVPMA